MLVSEEIRHGVVVILRFMLSSFLVSSVSVDGFLSNVIWFWLFTGVPTTSAPGGQEGDQTNFVPIVLGTVIPCVVIVFVVAMVIYCKGKTDKASKYFSHFFFHFKVKSHYTDYFEEDRMSKRKFVLYSSYSISKPIQRVDCSDILYWR